MATATNKPTPRPHVPKPHSVDEMQDALGRLKAGTADNDDVLTIQDAIAEVVTLRGIRIEAVQLAKVLLQKVEAK